MGILPDWMIEDREFITPLAKTERREGVISYGTTSYGYDARVGYKFKVFSPINATVIDPKAFDPKALVDVDLTPCEECGGTKITTNADDGPRECGCGNVPDHILIPPHSFVLAETVEEFVIPRGVLAVVVGKSTYARCGIIVNVTPLEPEWRGRVTVEISNTTPLPAKIYVGEGIMQILFFKGEGICRTSYADKKGKYQGQKGLTLPKVEGA